MSTSLWASITYQLSGQENSGGMTVTSVTVNLRDGECAVSMKGSGYIRANKLTMPRDLARAVAHAILAVEGGPVRALSFDVGADSSQAGAAG